MSEIYSIETSATNCPIAPNVTIVNTRAPISFYDFDGTICRAEYEDDRDISETQRIDDYRCYVQQMYYVENPTINTARSLEEMLVISEIAKEIQETICKQYTNYDRYAQFLERLLKRYEESNNAINGFLVGVYEEGLVVKIPREDQVTPEINQKLLEYVHNKNYSIDADERKNRFIITISKQERNIMNNIVCSIHTKFSNDIIATTHGRQSEESILKLESVVGIGKIKGHPCGSVLETVPNAGRRLAEASTKRIQATYLSLSSKSAREKIDKFIKSEWNNRIIIRGDGYPLTENAKIIKPCHIGLKDKDKATGQKVALDVLGIILGQNMSSVHHGNTNSDKIVERVGKVVMTRNGGPKFILSTVKQNQF